MVAAVEVPAAVVAVTMAVAQVVAIAVEVTATETAVVAEEQRGAKNVMDQAENARKFQG